MPQIYFNFAGHNCVNLSSHGPINVAPAKLSVSSQNVNKEVLIAQGWSLLTKVTNYKEILLVIMDIDSYFVYKPRQKKYTLNAGK